MTQFVNVVVDNKSEYTDRFYTYKAPADIQIGARVTIPFGKGSRICDAYVVETDVSVDFDASKVKEIKEYIPERSLNAEMIKTAVWMRSRYGVKFIDAIKMFTVPGVKIKQGAKLSDIAVRPSYELNEEQKSAAFRINEAIENEIFKAFLIKGVTNSGKTEVYMSAVEKALEKGRTAIVLLPEIALSKQTEERFKNRFGASKVATLHSKLSTSKRLEEWARIRRGEARIVVGARTSVFAPLENIGAIIIDEEHESTYKSDHNPKYETVDIAYRRASEHKAVLVLGSATPSIVSFYRARSGIYELLEMPHRVGDSVLPTIETVDMRKEARIGNTGVISNALADGISGSLNKREQIILFLNRRGFSTQIMCPDCGEKLICKDCGITLTYHKAYNAATCHYCGKRYPVPNACPKCGNKVIKYIGAGTEKVEESVRQLWPNARVKRFDLDTAGSEKEIKDVLNSFSRGETDILVGTQLLAKGLDFQNVGLVGIINADVSLNIPDFRSPERTYQLITQVAGRAGRAGGESRVLIQTYEPESELIRQAADSDYEDFYETELLHRNIMNYPPYSDIITITMVAKDEGESQVMEYAKAFRDRLRSMKNAPSDAVILPPREDARRTDGKERATFIIKAPSGSRGGYVNAYMKRRIEMIEEKAPCYIEIDINPYGII